MSPRRSRRPWRLLLLVALLALATPLWLPAIGLALVVSDPLAPADAVAPLAGGTDRARYAIALQRSGAAPWLVASDIRLLGPLGRLGSEQTRTIAAAAGLLPWHIYETDRVVRSTYQELLAIRALAERQGWRSLIIVTSPEHTRRTRIMANEAFRASGISVRVRPVEGHGYDPARWWRDERERTLTLTEYPKLLAFLLGYRGE